MTATSAMNHLLLRIFALSPELAIQNPAQRSITENVTVVLRDNSLYSMYPCPPILLAAKACRKRIGII